MIMLFPMNAGGGGTGILRRVVIGSAYSADPQTFNVASILPDIYQDLTIDNFAVVVNTVTDSSNSSYRTGALFNTYDATNGLLYTNRASNYHGSQSSSNECIYFTVVCYYVESVGGGGTLDMPALVESILWNNPNPVDTAFGGQNITLLDDMDNYDYLKFKFRFSTGETSAIEEVIYPVSVFKTYAFASEQPIGASLYIANSLTHFLHRDFSYISDTSIRFNDCYAWNGSGSIFVNNTTCIPLQVIGLKKTSAYSYNDPKVVDTHNIATGERYSFTLDADKEYILSAYNGTRAGCYVIYIKDGEGTTIVASGSLGQLESLTTTSATVYGYGVGNTTTTWTLIQLN